MKIITPGAPPPPSIVAIGSTAERSYPTRCPSCRCHFEFAENDATAVELVLPTLRLGSETPTKIVTLRCPQGGCGEELRVRLP